MSLVDSAGASPASQQFASTVQAGSAQAPQAGTAVVKSGFADQMIAEPRVNYAGDGLSERLSSPVQFGQSFKKVTGMGLLDTMPVQWLIFTECPCEVTAPARVELNFLSLAMTGNLRPGILNVHEITRANWFKSLTNIFSRAAARKVRRGGRRQYA